MTDRERFELRGPVHLCERELNYVYSDRDWLMRTTTEFSLEGNLLSQEHQNPDGSRWAVACRYDGEGRILEKMERGAGAGQEKIVAHYYYDDFGRLERVVERSAQGTERLSETRRYDIAGSKVVTIYPEPLLRERLFSVGDELTFQFSPEASSIVTFFDNRDRPVKRVFYDLNGRIDRRVILVYDARGRLIEEGEVEADGEIRDDLRNVLRYDDEGRVLEKLMERYAFGSHRKTFSYNDAGDVIAERNQRTLGILEEGEQDWTTHFRLRYDEGGNWTERIAETLSNGVTTVNKIERRRLTYH